MLVLLLVSPYHVISFISVSPKSQTFVSIMLMISLAIEMMREGYLVGSYWFTMYTTFFAVLSLAYFVVENTESASAKEILRDATAGRKALQELSRRSMAADRCSHTLTVSADSEYLNAKRSTNTLHRVFSILCRIVYLLVMALTRRHENARHLKYLPFSRHNVCRLQLSHQRDPKHK